MKYLHQLLRYVHYIFFTILFKKALNEGFTVLVGIGGGRCLDNVKCASVFSGLPVITVPTSIATCVATSMTCIMYNDKGQREPAVNLKKEVDVCIADMDLIATAPRRLLASGIMDSLPNIQKFHQLNISSYRDCQLKEYIQVVNAKIIYDFYLENILTCILREIKHHASRM